MLASLDRRRYSDAVPTQSHEDELLAPFANALTGADAAELARDTWRWLQAKGPEVAVSGERRLPALLAVACVYARHCAPRQASERQQRVVARFTLLFFLVDDAALEDLPELLSLSAPWSIGRYSSALAAWLDDFTERHSVPPALVERFTLAYHDYLDARRIEQREHSSPSGLEEQWAFRRRSIFMDPYLDLWLILRGVDPVGLPAELSEARKLAVDLVLLCNDLGSVERDRSGGAGEGDLNLVHSYAREYAEPESAALERVIELHNGLVERFRSLVREARQLEPSQYAETYAEILVGVVDGNRASVLALAFRYPGAEPIMRRLRSAR